MEHQADVAYLNLNTTHQQLTLQCSCTAVISSLKSHSSFFQTCHLMYFQLIFVLCNPSVSNLEYKWVQSVLICQGFHSQSASFLFLRKTGSNCWHQMLLRRFAYRVCHYGCSFIRTGQNSTESFFSGQHCCALLAKSLVKHRSQPL